MYDYQGMVRDFLKAARYPVKCKPITSTDLEQAVELPNGEIVAFIEYFRRRLLWMMEELNEFQQAINQKDIVYMSDCLADELYFVFGTAVSAGIDLGAVFNLVHLANMTKFHNCAVCNGTGKLAVYRASDGKLTKSANWQHPDLSTEIERQRK